MPQGPYGPRAKRKLAPSGGATRCRLGADSMHSISRDHGSLQLGGVQKFVEVKFANQGSTGSLSPSAEKNVVKGQLPLP